jgi:cytochrome-b5 reductase
MADSLFSRAYFDGVYIPAGLIVFGTYIMKQEYLPYATALAVVLAGFKFYNMREFDSPV